MKVTFSRIFSAEIHSAVYWLHQGPVQSALCEMESLGVPLPHGSKTAHQLQIKDK